MLLHVVAIGEDRSEGLREALAELVACAHLQRLAVAHDALACPGADRTGKALTVALEAREDGHRQDVDHHLAVDLLEDQQRELLCLRSGGVRGMALLPKELGRAQEQARTHLPAHDVGPVVHRHRQVAIAVDPLREEAVDDRLAGRADDDGFFKLLATGVGHDGELRAEALDVLRLTLDKALGDQQGEVGVLNAHRLDAVVELALDQLPDRVGPRANDHRSAHGPVVGQLGLGNEILIPAGEVLGLRGQNAVRHGTHARGTPAGELREEPRKHLRQAGKRPAQASFLPW